MTFTAMVRIMETHYIQMPGLGLKKNCGTELTLSMSTPSSMTTCSTLLWSTKLNRSLLPSLSHTSGLPAWNQICI